MTLAPLQNLKQASFGLLSPVSVLALYEVLQVVVSSVTTVFATENGDWLCVHLRCSYVYLFGWPGRLEQPSPVLFIGE